MNELVNIIALCPHCAEYIMIEKLNCCIFRHGTFITTNKQINPHSSKESCDKLKRENLIYGCGKTFKMIYINNNCRKM